jgi:hypothetical protein
MKKLFTTLILVFGLTSCDVTVTGYDFDKVIADDQRLLKGVAENLDVEVNLIEAFGYIESSPLEELFNIHRVVSMETVYAIGNCLVFFRHGPNEYDEYPVVEVGFDQTWELSAHAGSESDFAHDTVNTPRMNLVDAITYAETNDGFSKVNKSVILCTPTPDKTNNNNWYYVFCNKQDDLIKIHGQTGKRCVLNDFPAIVW